MNDGQNSETNMNEKVKEDEKLIHEGHNPQYAAGLKAVGSAVQHVFDAMPLNRGLKALFALNQKEKIDCPSCAWPDPDHKRSVIGEYCENGAKAIGEEATTRKVGLPLFQRYTVDELYEKSDFWLGKQGRITQPMYLAKGSRHYEPITWEKAFEIMAQRLKGLNNPNEAIFYTSGRSSNEAAYLYQLFVRAFGTNNMPDCSNMCHESSGVSLTNTLGIGKGSVSLEDFYRSELIIILGQNPGTNHPRMLTALEKAKENGAKIVAVNPLKETGLLGYKNPQTLKGIVLGGEKLTDLYLQIKINADMALLQLVGKYLLKESLSRPDLLDNDFIEKHTANFDDYKKALEQINEKELITATGLALEEIEQLAELVAQKKRIIICWAMGLTQHKNAVGTINELVNVLLLKG